MATDIGAEFAISRIHAIIRNWHQPFDFCPFCSAVVIEYGYRQSGSEFIVQSCQITHKAECEYSRLAALVDLSNVQIWTAKDGN